MTKNVKTDVLRVTIGNFGLGAVMVLIFALIGQFSLPVLWGAILGNSFVSLSFLWLAISVSKNVEKDPKNAQQRVSATYTYRLLAAAAVILIAVKFDIFSYVSTIIPLFYQRIVVMLVGKMRTREDNREVKAE